ncbi:MAG: glycerate kinase [Defluviitaleaceae bacterium]|nr:glycerate kinase [Defluviitaleaceae bacterium]
MSKIYENAQKMIKAIIADNMPRNAVENALKAHNFVGNIYLVAIGKAAWTMAEAASDFLGDRLVKGVVVTKYDHSGGDLPRIEIYEAGHPVSDENTFVATAKCIELAKELTADDELLFLVSGGGSALFEKTLDGIELSDLQDVNEQLLKSGADIVEINMVRKRFSAVKAGRFAQLVAPAKVFAVILSDVLGDRLDSIASGPAVPDKSTVEDAVKVVDKYNLKLTDLQRSYIMEETPKIIDNVTTVITGSVKTLCEAAASVAKELGYEPVVLTTLMNCEASEAGRMMGTIAADTVNGRNSFVRPCAIIAGGETIVTVKGGGKGGRNQELALASAKAIAGLDGVLIFSLGSDGTDGPTDAAGGIVNGDTVAQLKAKGVDVDKVLADNDAYNGLLAVDGLIMTGPTGTNVNDVTVILCD